MNIASISPDAAIGSKKGRLNSDPSIEVLCVSPRFFRHDRPEGLCCEVHHSSVKLANIYYR